MHTRNTATCSEPSVPLIVEIIPTHDNILVGVIPILNPLNAELNPICHLLALLGAHHIFHVSGLRVKYLDYCSSVSVRQTV